MKIVIVAVIVAAVACGGALLIGHRLGAETGALADWTTAAATAALAVVALFQDAIRAWMARPEFEVTVRTEPPDCMPVPISNRLTGEFIADSYYVRVCVKNVGTSTAKNVEVYAQELRRRRLDGEWERVPQFPPMNMVWADIGQMYFPGIAPEMSKHCDVAHIADPARRYALGEDVPRLNLADADPRLVFELICKPNHLGHIVGPGEYRLDILVAAENASPLAKTIAISVRGPWTSDEAEMFRNRVGIAVLEGANT